MGEGCFANPWQVFDQQVTAGKQAGECKLDRLVLAKNDSICSLDNVAKSGEGGKLLHGVKGGAGALARTGIEG